MSPSRLSGLWRLLLAVGIGAITAATIVAVSGDEANGGPEAGTSATRRWLPLSSSVLTRTEVGAARIGRFVYVVGGYAPPSGDTTDQVARYDIEADSWDLAASMPIGVNHPAVTAHRGFLYVHGGSPGSGATDALQRYDPASDSWRLLARSGPARAAGALIGVRGRIYAIGGDTGTREVRLVEIYEIAADRWRRGPGMRIARDHLGVARVGSRILALGGRAGGKNLRVVERLDTRTGRWVSLPRLGLARSGHQAVVVRGRVIAVGGEELAEGDETIAPVEIYQPRRRRWRRLAPMRTPRHGLGVVNRGRRIFAVEGGPHPGLTFSNALEFLDVPIRLLPRG